MSNRVHRLAGLFVVVAVAVAGALSGPRPTLGADLPNDPPHRYVVFLDGIGSQSSASSPAVRYRFSTIQDWLTPPRDGWAAFVYFSYGAAAHYRAGDYYCSGWGLAGCSGTSLGDLAALNLDPVYVPDDTRLSVDLHVEALDWLLRQIVARDSLARIDLVGYSLGGIVASRWAARLGGSSGLYERIHSIAIIESPVGGIPIAGASLEGCTLGIETLSCLVWQGVLLARFGETVLRELQLPVDDPVASIVASLPQAALTFDLTSIQSTTDYLVNGESVPICNLACLTSDLVPVGRGSQYWVGAPHILRTDQELGGRGLVTAPIWHFQAADWIYDNHDSPLFHPQTGQWVNQALGADGERWSALHTFSGRYTSPAPGLVGETVQLRAEATARLSIDHVNMTAYYSGAWHVIARFTGPGPYAFDWDISAIPAQEITLGFDVFDRYGGVAYSPEGQVVIARGAAPSPVLASAVTVSPNPASTGQTVRHCPAIT